MKDSNEWTTYSSILLIFVLLDLIIIAILLVIHFEIYPAIESIVKGLYAAVIALLTTLGVMKKKPRSLASLLSSKVTRQIVIVITLIIFLGSPVLVLYKYDIHKIEIDARIQGINIPVRMEMINNNNKNIRYENEHNITTWRFWVKRGNYTLHVSPIAKEYMDGSLPVDICLFCLKKTVLYEVLVPDEGKLSLTFSPIQLNLTILKDKANEQVFRGQVNEKKREWTLKSGLYELSATKKGYYKFSIPLQILRGKITEHEIKLNKRPPPQGTLVIRPKPKGMHILINGRPLRGLITPQDIKLPPGRYKIVLHKAGINNRYGFYFEEEKTIKNNERVKIDPSLVQKELTKLIIVPSEIEEGIGYFLDGNWESKSLGAIKEPMKFYVFPGKYKLKKRKNKKTINSVEFVIRQNIKKKRIDF
jgi:hypothetical protein